MLPGLARGRLRPGRPVLALAALAAALLSPRPMTGRRRSARRAGAALAIGLVVLARPACAPLAGMLLVPFPPPGRLARACRDRLPLAVFALLPALPAASLGLPHPAGAGDGFGSLPVPLPGILYALWAAALLVPPFALRRRPLPRSAERLLALGGALLGLWLTVLAQALAPAAGHGGLQVRDLPPLVPMLDPGLRPGADRHRGDPALAGPAPGAGRRPRRGGAADDRAAGVAGSQSRSRKSRSARLKASAG